ncbi:hypothetical protein [Methanobacterium sp. SMA-27]|uniref:hypothetical protein n=1 Tax=Methanobacterium sp. SMA-27 TaxID=1495336 RepID=UPI00064F0F83|nr:hypothetical protein [Methanobacterium sp. SMA-27]
MNEKSVVGDLINFRGLVYSPMNENGVIFLFGKVMDELNMYVEEIKPGFPDCIGRRFNGKGWERIRIEFEYVSSNFKLHKHDPKKCDMIICWEHDWDDCKLEVIELKDFIKNLKDITIKRPAEDLEDEKELEIVTDEFDVNELHKFKESNYDVVKILKKLDYNLKGINEKIWSKIGKSGISYYSPERVFISAFPQPDKILLYIFVGNGNIVGIDKTRLKTMAKYGVAEIKDESEIDKLSNAFKISHKNIMKAIKNNEPLNA